MTKERQFAKGRKEGMKEGRKGCEGRKYIKEGRKEKRKEGTLISGMNGAFMV